MKKTRRARSERAGRRGAESRDSSVSSSEVRCACQYFQSDSLLPERSALLLASRPSSRASGETPATAPMGDHEYEPISPPPGEARMEVEAAAARRRRSSSEAASVDGADSPERRFLHVQLQDNVAVPGDGRLEDEAMAGRELGDTNNGDDDEDTDDGPVGAAKLQARLEERFLNETPTTMGSRTDGEFNTSNVDSSALEDLPLQKEARRRKQEEETAAEEQKTSRASNFQQRLRSQAGKLRTRLRNIKKPTFTMPERPKITLPERPRFHLPERPKFTMPERPKFNLPQRPKFTMPERPKFNLPQRPKISMPTISSLSSKTKGKGMFSSTRRPLRDRSANVSSVSTTSSKKKMFDFDFRTYPRLFDRKSRPKPKGQRAETPPPPAPLRKKGPVGHRWLHRFKDIMYADEDPGPPSGSEGTPRQTVESQGSGEQADPEECTWEERQKTALGDDIETAGVQRQDSGLTESTSELKDKDFGDAASGEAATLGAVPRQVASSGSFPESDQEQRSSGSSSDRHRAGVLEEIDSDEFFLRQKGISQEDVVLGRMLTSEIREAFRSPTGALLQRDSYEYDDEGEAADLGQQYRSTPEREPTRPARTRSLRPRKRSSRSKESSPTEEQAAPFFNTFPPTRPKRGHAVRKQEGDVEGEQEEVAKNEEDRQEEEEIQEEEMVQEVVPEESARPSLQKEESGEAEEVSMEEVVDDGLEGQEVDLPEKEESPAHPEIVITDVYQQETYDEQFADEDQQQWRYENDLADEPLPTTPPTAPRRKKRTLKQSLPDSLCNGSYTKEDWMENVSGHITPDEIIALRMESEYIIPDVPDGEEFEMPPVAPKRVRRRSKGSRGASLLEDEDRTSHAASSLPAEEAPPHIDIGDMSGYACVVKPVPVKPDRPRRPKPARPPPPGRRKKSNCSKLSHFFSLPRKPPPLRPVRNYSTLGPSRPPRRERLDEPRFAAQGDPSEPYFEIQGDELPQEESLDSSRDLQSGDIIEKMKGRPLPPPPRPPRKTKEGRDTLSQFSEEDMHEVQEDVALAALRDDVFYSQKGSVSSLQHDRLRAEGVSMAKMSLDPEEITVSTQTDPLMDEYCEDLVDGEPLKEHVLTMEVDERGRSPKEKEKPDQSLFYPKERSAPTTEPWPREEEIIESAVLGRLVCRSEASPESTVLEHEARKSPAIARSKTPPAEIITERIIERHIPYHVGPDERTEVELLRTQRLQVSELDVERLNVGELQAQKIVVSDIDGVSMQVAELTSKSGNLVVNGIELPPGFVQELYDARPSQPTHVILECSSTQTVEEPQQVGVAEETQKQERSQAVSGALPQEGIFPLAAQQYGGPQFGPLSMAPPGMHFVPAGSYMETYQEYSPPVPPPPRMSSRQRARELESEDEVVGVVPRRRRHLVKPVSRYSSDEEEEEPVGRATPQFHAPSRRHGAKSSDVPAVELARQLLQRLETTPAGRWVRRAWAVVAPSSEERRRNLQTALCVLLVLLALLILLGFGSGKTFHHHHWDYYFPPPI